MIAPEFPAEKYMGGGRESSACLFVRKYGMMLLKMNRGRRSAR